MESREKSLLIVQLAHSRRAQDLVVLDLRGLVSYTDYFLICSGRSDRQVQAIAEHVEAELRAQKIRPRSIEGLSTGRWVLMDYDDVIVHVFQQSGREFYDLEGLWSDAPRVALPRDEEDDSMPGDSPND
jgi:ribosome-associated protein